MNDVTHSARNREKEKKKRDLPVAHEKLTKQRYFVLEISFICLFMQQYFTYQAFLGLWLRNALYLHDNVLKTTRLHIKNDKKCLKICSFHAGSTMGGL